MVVTPTSVDLRGGDIQKFTVDVPGDAENGVTWNAAPTIGDIANGTYQAPNEILEDREIQITATSTIDPHKSAIATVQLRSKPLGLTWTISLFVYLVVVFALVVVLTSLWPPPLPDASAVEKARTARSAADAAVPKAKEDEQKAAVALQSAKDQAGLAKLDRAQYIQSTG